MIDIRRPPAWLLGSAAALFLASVVLVVLGLPPKVFPTASWHDGGLRLFRDDHETSIYFERSRWIDEGAFPYTAGHEQEYPPAAALYFALPRLFFHDQAGYEKAFLFLNAALFALLVGLTVALLRRFGRPARLAWLLFLPASLYFSIWRFDLLPAVLVAWFLLAAIDERMTSAFVALTLAVLTKYYPALFFLPLFMMLGARSWSAETIRRSRNGLLAVAAIVVVVIGIVAATAGFATLVSPLVFHLSRDFEVGSLGALLLWYPVILGADISLIGRALLILFTVLQLAPAVLFVMRGRVLDRVSLVRGCLFLLLPFLLFNRFFSPQWLLWFTPIYLLVSRPRETAALAVLDILTFLQFPVFFGIDPYGLPYFFVCLARTAIIAYLAVVNWRAMEFSGPLAMARHPSDHRSVEGRPATAA